jgi:hypothetical protein
MNTRLAILPLAVVFAVGLVSPAETGESLLEHLVALFRIPDMPSHPLSVFRFDLDITGDGVPELFLGQNYATSNRGMNYVVYSGQPNGQYKPLGVVELGYDGFCYFAERSVILNIRRAGPGLGLSYDYYHAAEDGVWEIRESVPWTPGDDLPLLRAWRDNGRPLLYTAPLSDLRGGTPPTWREFESKHVIHALGSLDQRVTESGDCSAERFLDEYRNAGCLELPHE